MSINGTDQIAVTGEGKTRLLRRLAANLGLVWAKVVRPWDMEPGGPALLPGSHKVELLLDHLLSIGQVVSMLTPSKRPGH
jgi:hypothetical protein